MMSNNQLNQLSHQNGKGTWYYWLKQSAIFAMLWLNIILVYSIVCAHTNQLGQDEFYRVIFFMRHPIVIGLTIIAFLSTVIFSVTWCYGLSQTLLVNNHQQKKVTLLITFVLLVVLFVISGLIYSVILGYFR